MSITTNKVIFDINHSTFAKRYDIFAIKKSDGHFKYGAKLLDTQVSDNRIKAIYYESGSVFYVLMEKSDDNRKRLISVFTDDDISIEKTSSRNLDSHELLQLMLNSLYTYLSEELAFNNITGHLYYFHKDYMHYAGKNKDVIKQIHSLNIRVDRNMLLTMKVKTFTALKEFVSKKYDSYTKYVYDGRTLRRMLSSDKDMEIFIAKQYKGKKNTIDFVDVHKEKNFEKSKLGVLNAVLTRFKSRFADIATITFEEIHDVKTINYDSSEEIEAEKYLSGVTLKVINGDSDNIDDSDVDSLVESLKESITQIEEKTKHKLNIKVTKGKKKSDKCYNIVLIHNKDYYKNNDDRYKTYSDYVVQHVTIEDFKADKNEVKVVLSELAIKHDLQKKQLSLYKWNYDSDISFGISHNEEGDIERYYFMTIHPDGTFEIEEKELDFFSNDFYSECASIFNENGVCGVVGFGDDIEVIYNTDMYTLPNTDEIKQGILDYANGETEDGLRAGVNRGKIEALIDINTFERDGDIYYFVGKIGKGMKSNVDRAALIRRCHARNGERSQFEKLAPLMDVKFVRNDQYTVVPFPFKYLREELARRKTSL